jgi:hypothetical protein
VELSALRLQVYDRTGVRLLTSRDVRLAAMGQATSDALSLPFSFSVAPEMAGTAGSVRVVVTGRGPSTAGLVDVVEQQSLVSFAPPPRELVRVVLARTCYSMLCRAGSQLSELSCDPGTGTCSAIPALGTMLQGTEADAAVEGGVQPERPDAQPDAGKDAGGAEAGSSLADGASAPIDAEAPQDAVTSTPSDAAGGADAADAIAPPVSDVCRGAAGSKVCDANTLVTCDANGQIVSTSSCLSARHCQVATARGKCPACLEGEFHCEGATLQRCGADGEWVTAQTCTAAALCSETAHACTTAFCAPKAPSCQGDMLQVCNDAQTAFQDVKKCDPGLCDRVAGECDVCVSNSKACEADGRSVRTCAANGQTSSVAACASDKPLCTGAGNCVQCKLTMDCSKPSNECLQASCNVAAGTCGTAVRNAHTACSGGVCDGSGNCVGCVDHSDCSARSTTLKYCSGGSCVACTSDSQCNQGAHEACKNNRCVVQSWCGDGMVSGGEDCDPKHSSWSPYTCSETCIRRNLYQPCSSNDECITQGWGCAWGYCTSSCASMACPASPVSGLTAACTGNNALNFCFLKGCTSITQCPKGTTCREFMNFGFVCVGCQTDTDCPNNLACVKNPEGVAAGLCQ